MAGPVVVSIIGDTRDLMSKLGQSEGRLGKFGRAAGTMGKLAGAGLAAGAVAVGGLAIAAVKSASDAEQSLGATETVFGKFADTVVANSKRASTQYGLSANDYRESSNLIGSLFKNQGVAADQLAGKTDKMVGLGADLAATFGGKTSEAVEALGSAFKGEFDPLERFGISIKQSAINAELARKGQDKLTGAALKQAQQQATTSLIMKQAKDSLGAFGRENDTVAHQGQVLGAQWEDLKAKGGAVLLPVLTKLGQAVNEKLFPAINRMGPPIQRFATQAGAVLGPILARVGGLMQSLWPVVLRLVSAIGSVVPPIVAVAGQVGKNLKPILDQLVTTFQTRVLPTLIAAAPTVRAIATTLGTFAGKALLVWSAVAGKVLPVVIRLAGFILSKLVPVLLKTVLVAVRVITTLASFGLALTKAVVKTVGFAVAVVKAIAGIPGKVNNAIGALVQKGKDLITGLIRGIGDKFGDLKNKAGEIATKAKNGAGDLLGVLKQKGRDLIQGLINGIEEKISVVKDKITAALNWVKDHLPGSPIKRGPLRGWNDTGKNGPGGRLMGLLATGIENSTAIERAMTRTTDRLNSDLSVAGRSLSGSFTADLKTPAVATTVGAGGVTIEINLNDIPIGATGADIGRELAEYLRDYFAAGGARL